MNQLFIILKRVNKKSIYVDNIQLSNYYIIIDGFLDSDIIYFKICIIKKYICRQHPFIQLICYY